mmetsp:Transcript_26482/g.41062  ORF Transcript_26482/g.41062 Transcript_26482/m.41062 type:complete len:399 (+) Transcript_26482:59-1255(+)|eukprot:CAMPEP_0196824234 /NCGR_PEP_ID=MMETSP1362-20130617/90979_1 /TAXON_ID=163516 /ORGANISM="Leptocylindrus danicus, Strain CCMP1856" /LENGTH=398 /DNA_ID=CAMNT_0042204421 /DNA_START=9 /DNA_END=1205 /DNA_ORIENTATION=+
MTAYQQAAANNDGRYNGSDVHNASNYISTVPLTDDCHLHCEATDDTITNSIITSTVMTTTTTTAPAASTNDSTNATVSAIIGNYLQSPLFKELVACMLLCTILVILPEAFVPLYRRPVPYQLVDNTTVILDFNLNYPHEDPEISDATLICVAIVFPVIVVVLLEIVSMCCMLVPPNPRNDKQGGGHHFHAGMCTLFVAFGFTAMITDFTKRYVGRLRPNFYDQCGFDVDTLECSSDTNDYDEARKSFISGHASLSFCGMTVLAQILVGTIVATYRELRMQLLVSSRQQQQQQSTASASSRSVSDALLSMRRQETALTCAAFFLPLIMATYIAMSRLRDNWHHPSDVVAGAFVGVFFAVVAYGLWYPPVRSGSVHVGVPYLYQQAPRHQSEVEAYMNVL